MRSDELYDLLYQERCIGNIKDEQEKRTAELCLREDVDMFLESSFCRNCTPEEFELWRDDYQYKLAIAGKRRRRSIIDMRSFNKGC